MSRSNHHRSDVSDTSPLWALSHRMDPAEEGLLKPLHSRRHRLNRGSSPYQQGQALTALYLVQDGMVKTQMESRDGAVQVMGFHQVGELIGLDALSSGIHMTTAVAVDTAIVEAISWPHLNRTMRHNAALLEWVLQRSSLSLAALEESLVLVGSKNGVGRLSSFLVAQSLRRGSESPALEFTLEMTRADIAHYVGLTKESTSRLLQQLEKRGLVALKHKALRIRNFNALCRLAGIGLTPTRPDHK